MSETTCCHPVRIVRWWHPSWYCAVCDYDSAEETK